MGSTRRRLHVLWYLSHLLTITRARLMLYLDYATKQSVETFWRVVDGFDRKQREDLLKFVTSCSRPPLLGFRELHPPFCIQKVFHSVTLSVVACLLLHMGEAMHACLHMKAVPRCSFLSPLLSTLHTWLIVSVHSSRFCLDSTWSADFALG